MTRQKKELIRKMNELQEAIWADEALGCGFAPAGWYDPEYARISEWGDELARLSHFKNYDDYRMDWHGELALAGSTV